MAKSIAISSKCPLRIVKMSSRWRGSLPFKIATATLDSLNFSLICHLQITCTVIPSNNTTRRTDKCIFSGILSLSQLNWPDVSFQEQRKSHTAEKWASFITLQKHAFLFQVF